MVANRNRWLVGTLEEVGEFFGRSIETVKGWRSVGMPGRKGRWDLAAISRWLIGRRGGGPGEASKLAGGDAMAQAKLAREIARAKREQILLRQLEGTLIDRDEAEGLRLKLCQSLAGVLDRMETELPMVLKGKPAAVRRKVILEYLDRQRDELAGGGQWGV